MGLIKQLRLEELSALVKLCDENNKTLKRVIDILTTHPENQFIFDYLVSVTIGTDLFDFNEYVFDARFVGFKIKVIPKDKNNKFNTSIIPIGVVNYTFQDEIHQRRIYSLLESTSREILSYYKILKTA